MSWQSKMRKTDVLIAGTGCSALYCALWIPSELSVTMITKAKMEDSDSFLAQGGMCMLKDESDFESFFEDTLKAGHYENDRKSVELMIHTSPDVLKDLEVYGVDFRKNEAGEYEYTREGAHSSKRILFHEDITGKEITSHLLAEVKSRSNVTILENTTLVDIIEQNSEACGGVVRLADNSIEVFEAKETILATGGVGGLYRFSTNFRHLTGDALAIAVKHKVDLQNVNYVQIHPTTLFSEKPEERSFLISESVRGEGAKLYGKDMKRFVNELLPRDLLSDAIHEQMKKDGMDFVWEDLRTIPEEELDAHFPNIVAHCREMGYDVKKECIPVVPAQHYFMGGIKVNHESQTTMEHLYAVGETACNGVHGKNRLASNSLLESLVFAKRAAMKISKDISKRYYQEFSGKVNFSNYEDIKRLEDSYRAIVKKAMDEADAKTNSKVHITAGYI